MITKLGGYEYAGFHYTVSEYKDETRPDAKTILIMSPVPGQRPEAAKNKHLKAALACYMEQTSWKRPH